MRRTARSAGMATIVSMAAAVCAWANNVTVTNTDLRAPASGKVAVQFDLSWDNSWRDAVNHDACWLFVKYSADGGATWNHATLAASGTNPSGFSDGSGTSLDIIVPADKMGAFIQRSGEGVGTVANTGVRLSWDFATNGLDKTQNARVKVFAIEMVHVPTGSFYVGSGGTETTSLTEGPWTTGATTPFLITNEAAMLITNAAGYLWDCGTIPGGTLANEFPKGYAAFYLMKTEISQRQYCDFLNTLTRAQQAARVETTNADYFAMGNSISIKNRNGIRCPSVVPAAPEPIVFGCDGNANQTFNETNDGQWVSCNFLSTDDGMAYADWAALRPFTELEFEKACRGPLPPVPNEYAWGATNLVLPTSLTDTNTAFETPSPGQANFLGTSGSPAGPYRCGSFARSDTTRTNSGAGYYGALDLSGNVNERPVSLVDANGRAFTGQHGDGALSAAGAANVSAWPVTYRSSRGAQNLPADSRTSDRTYYSWMTKRYAHSGWRGARTTP